MLGAPHADTTSDLADWLELHLLTGDAWRVTETNARGQVETTGMLDAFGPLVAGAVMKMRRRATVLGSAYPFEATAAGLRRVRLVPTHLPYVALLAVSQWQSVRPDDPRLHEAASEFEQICEVVLESLGGPGGKTVHFGWPSRSGRPERFPEAIRWLTDRLERVPGDGFRDPRRRDGGVDLIAWRELPDGVTYDHRLVQCTIGRDLLRKAREIDVDQWERWVRFVESPRIVLAVPFEVSARDVAAREARSMGSIVLDRGLLIRSATLDEPRLAAAGRRALDAVGLDLRFDSSQ